MASAPDQSLLKPLLVIVGSTASGKTALAIELAKQFNGEIICADSRTIYTGMDIGTAKPKVPERHGIPHHLLGVVAPSEPFTVADFQKLANEIIADIHARGKLPILVGGSGLYIDAVIYNYQFSRQATPRDGQNPRHMAADTPAQKSPLRPSTLVLGMDVDQDALAIRIAERIDTMLAAGLVDEARHMADQYGWDIEAMKTYEPLREYLNGHETIEQAKEKMIIKDRQLAKKQRTWFKRNNSIHWLNDPSKAVDLTTTLLNKSS